MTKEQFHTKWYYRLLKVLFISSYLLLSVFLIVAGYFGSDVEIAGLVWAVVIGIVYWFTKRIFYYVAFGDGIFGNKKVVRDF